MPTAEQVFKVLREQLTDDELREMSGTLSRLLSAYDDVAAKSVVNPVLLSTGQGVSSAVQAPATEDLS